MTLHGWSAPSIGVPGGAWPAGVVVVTMLVAAAARADHPFFDQLAIPEKVFQVQLEPGRRVTMRDGKRLSTDVYLPVGVAGPLPVVLIRTPYDKNLYRSALATQDQPIRSGPIARNVQRWEPVFFAQHGLAVVVQDHRGRFESEGEFFPYPATDGPDGYDTISWVVRQPWSNGKVATFGCSYVAETQHMLATLRHPNHTAAIAEAGSSTTGAGGVWNFGFTRYGATELAVALNWNFRRTGRPTDTPEYPGKMQRALATLPVIQAMTVLGEGPVPSAFEDWLRYADEPRHAYWTRQGMVTEADRFSTPTLHVSSWYDVTPSSTLKLFRLFSQNATNASAREHQYLIMGATTHCESAAATRDEVVGDRPVGNAYVNLPAVYLAWFDHWLRDSKSSITTMPKVSSFVLGRGMWRTADRWPLPAIKAVNWYLHSDGRANSRDGDGRLSLEPPGSADGSDEYAYDPAHPITQGSMCCMGPGTKEGGVDQHAVELRKDVLVYTSNALTKGVEVAGALEAVLHVSSSAKDTDFVCKLVDVYPDGTAYVVQEGIVRARWREGLDRKVLMEEGQVYRVRVDLEATHNYFAPGHRIRVDVSSSSFPRWDRNLNTGGANFDESEFVVARNRVHHSARWPSHIVLPVLQRE